ncbi:hypothetical protein WCQ02_12395 [Paraburkholderia tropica]|uniref:hypothetical protein n=1 Tax=Paraburkholderia tropica TaxID=92647 RepID=UPI0030175E30
MPALLSGSLEPGKAKAGVISGQIIDMKLVRKSFILRKNMRWKRDIFMHYNICIVRPVGYPHSDAFSELAEIVAYALEDLGNTVQFTENNMVDGARNILIGCHLAEPYSANYVPSDTIVLNTEQIHVDEQDWNRKIYFWTSRYETWDYSERNLVKLRSLGAQRVKHLRLGFHPNLCRIPTDVVQDIDVLFYGTIGSRRKAILDALIARGIKVCAVDCVYGAARDALIARSKVVLNMHHFSSHIFEIVRVFYLMSNSKAVVGEVSLSTSIDPAYLNGFEAATYDNLVETCVELVGDSERRRKLEQAASETIRRHSQAKLIALLLMNYSSGVDVLHTGS